MLFWNYNTINYQYKPNKKNQSVKSVEIQGGAIANITNKLSSIQFKKQKPSNNIKFIL